MAVIKSKNGILNAIRRFAPSECHFGRGRLSLVSAVVGVPDALGPADDYHAGLIIHSRAASFLERR
jgi:hypothetical protein